MINRGEIWWADLEEPGGSGPGCRRPVIIIQSNDFNRSLIRTVVAVVVTTNLRLSGAPGNVSLSKKQTKLPKESVANVSQIITLDKDLLIEKIGRLPDRSLRAVEDGIRLVLSL